jgi:Bifunctional DNA primase/polymerase, N-terminal
LISARRPARQRFFFTQKGSYDLTRCRARRIRKGFSPVPVPYRSKKPVLDAWQQLEITVETAPAYFGNPALNIGVLLGDKFGSADVDCDCAEAIGAARELLPETGIKFGRQSKPFSHYLYRSDPPVRTQKFLDPIDHATLIELRGLSSDGNGGLQTAVPPGTHQTGEAIRFEKCFEETPANVEADDLISAVHELAAVALLARYWPKKGVRHHTFLALAGVLARAQWKGGEITGVPTLNEFIDKKVIDVAFRWLGIDRKQHRDYLWNDTGNADRLADQLRIDGALMDREKGTARIWETKTMASDSSVPVPPNLAREIAGWIARHPERTNSRAFLFPSRRKLASGTRLAMKPSTLPAISGATTSE